MSNGTPFVSQASYMWKSANIGHDRIDIQPQDSKFKLGRYYIGAMPYRNGLNTFFVSLTLTDASKTNFYIFSLMLVINHIQLPKSFEGIID